MVISFLGLESLNFRTLKFHASQDPYDLAGFTRRILPGMEAVDHSGLGHTVAPLQRVGMFLLYETDLAGRMCHAHRVENVGLWVAQHAL